MTKNDSTIYFQKRCNSPNGDISMWLSRFSDLLVVHGLDEFYRAAHEESNHSPEKALCDDWHFFRLGVEGLSHEKLKRVIASLKGPFALIERLGEEYRRCAESIEKVEEEWLIASEQVKQQLAVWEPWAVEAEIRWRKRSFPWTNVSGCDQLLLLQVSLTIRGAGAELESPQRLKENLSYFEARIKGIRATISDVYLNSNLPAASSVYCFDMTLNNLMKHQTQFNKLLNQKTEILEKLNLARDEYWTKKTPLAMLLDQLPDTAQRALFRICRPDLHESSVV